MDGLISWGHLTDYLTDWAVLVAAYLIVLAPRLRRHGRRLRLLHLLTALYVGFVIMLTLMPFSLPFIRPLVSPWASFNLDPFVDLRLARPAALWEIAMNILVMVPFGLLWGLTHRHPLLAALCATFILSLVIETGQLLQVWWGAGHRVFDVTDIITNTFGGLLGAAALMAVRHLAGGEKKRN